MHVCHGIAFDFYALSARQHAIIDRVAGHPRSLQVAQIHRRSPVIYIACHQRLTQGDLRSATFALPAIQGHLRSPQATAGRLWLDPTCNFLSIYSSLIHLKFIYNCLLSCNAMAPNHRLAFQDRIFLFLICFHLIIDQTFKRRFSYF